MGEAQILKFAGRQEIKTKLVCSACGAPGEGSCHCGAPYVTPGERAEAAVKANPEKSDRAIAAEIGVNQSTVSRVRKRVTDAGASVEKRTGRDGKKRRAPKPRKRAANQEAKAREIVRPLVGAGESMDYVKLGKQHDIAHVTIEKAAAIEFALLHETVDIDTLPKTAKEKLEIAKRMIQRKLDAEHAVRMRNLDEEVRQRVIAEGKEYLAMVKKKEEEADKTIALYQEWTNNRKPLFTVEQFKTILMCLHPDGQRTANKLAEAFRLFNAKKFQLTGDKG